MIGDGGLYTCMAEFNVTGYNNDTNTATYDYQEASDSLTLIINCKLLISIILSILLILQSIQLVYMLILYHLVWIHYMLGHH